jgi:hypothetical protein
MEKTSDGSRFTFKYWFKISVFIKISKVKQINGDGEPKMVKKKFYSLFGCYF